MPDFAAIDLNRDPVPDATTLLKFRHWLERHDLTRALFDEIAAMLEERGLFRRRGVPVERIILSDADLLIEARHSHAALCDGFHEDEAAHRWTDGLARLPEAWLRSFPGAFTLDLHLAPSGLGYRLPAPARSHAVAAA